MKKDKQLNSTLYNIGEYDAERDMEQVFWEQDEPVFSEEYENRKQAILNGGDTKKMRKNTFFMKRAAIAAACAAVLFATSLGVYAASKYFSTDVKQTDSTLEYSFDIDYTLTPHKVVVKPGYLPEGYQEWEEDKYSYNGEYGADGITIAVFTAAHVDALDNVLTVIDVDTWEEATLAGTKAHVIQVNERHASGYDRIILFYEEEGFLVEIFGTQKLGIEELKKVADQITYTITDEKDEYLTADEKDYMKGDDEDPRNLFVKESKISAIGDEFADEREYVTFTVTGIDTIDSIAEFDTSLMLNYDDMVAPNLNEDKSIQDYNRIMMGDELEDAEPESVSRDIVQAKIRVKNNSNDIQNVFAVPEIAYLKEADTSAIEADVPDNVLEVDTTEYIGEGYEFKTLNYDRMPFYFSAAIDMEKGYYFIDLKPGEELEYTVLFDVDRDRLDSAYLYFNMDGMAHEYDNLNQKYIPVK